VTRNFQEATWVCARDGGCVERFMRLPGSTIPRPSCQIIVRVHRGFLRRPRDARTRAVCAGNDHPDVIESAVPIQEGDNSNRTTTCGAATRCNLSFSSRFVRCSRTSARAGLALGLPREYRISHPFPEPGLGFGSWRVRPRVRRSARRADAIFIEELPASGWYERTARPSRCSCGRTSAVGRRSHLLMGGRAACGGITPDS